MKLLTTIVHSSIHNIDRRILNRRSVRAVIMQGGQILLMYSARHNDYSLPGGTVERGEDLIAALRRELLEETGAYEVHVEQYLGYVDEYRPSPRAKFDVMFLRSYCYQCHIKADLSAAQLNPREIANGLQAVWIDLAQAIAHNEKMIISSSDKLGISIQRETWLLKYIQATI
ncbi:NUDIX domain-containing protein [Chitinibacter sp. SCUT-21]|uniref:NUDIX hydrolase n=1 Tax=Chitinibacter sp. SCUT-21 TaxID=2970891 RepID=UPI0035A5BACB